MRECWAIEEQDTETDEWFTVEAHANRDVAETHRHRWVSEYPHRVVRYVPDDTVAQVIASPSARRSDP